MAHAGRWALLRRAGSEVDKDPRLEHIARSLLRRYGVVCWRLLEREAMCCRRGVSCCIAITASKRGEIRGGRFIAGLAGEQFALPEAIGVLRQVRRREADGALVVVSGCDPLNLVGTLLPGAKVPAVNGNRLLYRDGVAVACRVAGKYQYLVDVPLAEQTLWHQRLLRNGY
jgi:ATP-dependent Lhr-like helicase